MVPCTSPAAGSFADSLSFLYVVSPGDYSSDLSYTDTEALSLASGANSLASSAASTTEVVDESGDPANVTLPPVASEFSVTGGEERQALEAVEPGSGALVVDTSNLVLYVTALNGDGIYYAGESIFIQARSFVLYHESYNRCHAPPKGEWWLNCEDAEDSKGLTTVTFLDVEPTHCHAAVASR